MAEVSQGWNINWADLPNALKRKVKGKRKKGKKFIKEKEVEESNEKVQRGAPISNTTKNKKKKSVTRLKRTAFFEPSLAQKREEYHPISKKDIKPTPSQPRNIEKMLSLDVSRSINKINKERHKEKEFTSSFFM